MGTSGLPLVLVPCAKPRSATTTEPEALTVRVACSREMEPCVSTISGAYAVDFLLNVIKDGELVDTHELSASKRVYKVGRQAGVADMFLSKGRGPGFAAKSPRVMKSHIIPL